MRNFILLICFITFMPFYGCVKKPIFKTVVQEYQKIDFIPQKVEKEVSPNFKISISPIDHRETDRETFLAAQRDGIYENETIKSWKNKASGSTDKTTSKILNIFTEIDRLISWKFLPPDVGYEFKLQMINNGNYANGSEVETLMDSLGVYPDLYNPFLVNQRYLSVFKVVFSNETDNVINVSSNNFQIISGSELLNPLKTEYFEKTLVGISEKIKNIYRMNMPDNMTIVPHQSIIKYLAVPSINLENDKLILKMIFDNMVVDFDYSITKTPIKKTYNFQELKIQLQSFQNPPTTEYIVIKQGNRTFSLRNKTLYILSDLNNEPFSIYGASFDSWSRIYGKSLRIKLSDGLGQTIKIPMWEFNKIEESPDLDYDLPLKK